MESSNPKEFIWAQSYRPRKVDDCILPQRIKDTFKGMIEKGEVTHMILVGGPGMGKTTTALAMANELECDVMVINATMENGIDVLRTKIQSFASSISLSDSGPKLVILDEADGLTPVMQAGLKGFIEAFSSNCRFIMTANNKHKLIDPIRSRCLEIDFSFQGEEKTKIAANFFRRVVDILKAENVKFDPKVVAKLVERNFPDFRKTLNELQRQATIGVIDSSSLIDHSSETYKEFIKALKKCEFPAVREWIGKNQDIDSTSLFREIYNAATTQMKEKSLPSLILILADYGYKSAFCPDQQINSAACMVEIMSQCQWEE